MGGSSLNPLSLILKENKLIGPNYIDWKRNLNLVLTAEEYKFVLTDVCPPPPDSDSSKEEVEIYQRWRKADEMAMCYILAFMSNILQHQHENMATAYDMIMNLKHEMARCYILEEGRWDGKVLYFGFHVQYITTPAWEHGYSLWHDNEPQRDVWGT